MNATITYEQAIALGGTEWTSSDGTIIRVYINSSVWAPLVGLEVDYYKSGNIRSAAVNGTGISNAGANRILAMKAYVDIHGLHVQGEGDWKSLTSADLAAAIEKAVAAL